MTTFAVGGFHHDSNLYCRCSQEDIYIAQCLELGTVSQAESLEETITNLKEATELYLAKFPLPSNNLSTPT